MDDYHRMDEALLCRDIGNDRGGHWHCHALTPGGERVHIWYGQTKLKTTFSLNEQGIC